MMGKNLFRSDQGRHAGLLFLLLFLFLVFDSNVQAVETITLPVHDIGSREIPLDPNDHELWDNIPETVLKLAEQNILKPKGGGATNEVQVRAVHNNGYIAFLLQWKDDTPNWERLKEFGDAAALQFPSNGTDRGSAFMGESGFMVNIWQWKADWQRDVQGGFQGTKSVYPGLFSNYTSLDSVDYAAEVSGNPNSNRSHRSSAGNFLARGFGTLTYIPQQDVSALGEYKDGVWKVVFLRALETSLEGGGRFEKGEKNFAAFAIWDGGEHERNGMKSFTKTWVLLDIQ